MDATSEDIQSWVLALNNFTLVFENAMAFDLVLFNTVLFANIMAYVTGHVTGRVLALMRKG
ncbi:MAG: hypothetical protein COA42_23675 [Alteromonadaceae bacterium]|nr:MAG: hypothetical protein COA42_23675 [Alteromonadaceae bacterium]